jgi:hypothetical protein
MISACKEVGSARNVWGLREGQRFVRGPVGEGVPTKAYILPPENMAYSRKCNYMQLRETLQAGLVNVM